MGRNLVELKSLEYTMDKENKELYIRSCLETYKFRINRNNGPAIDVLTDFLAYLDQVNLMIVVKE